jgi:hypothetical protein
MSHDSYPRSSRSKQKFTPAVERIRHAIDQDLGGPELESGRGSPAARASRYFGESGAVGETCRWMTALTGTPQGCSSKFPTLVVEDF